MTDDDIRSILKDRLAMVDERIRAACGRAKRAREEVTLVAVTKTVSAKVAGMLPEMGVIDLGESRPQELKRKAKVLEGRGIRWHMIGHLQRNKVADVIPLVDTIHSVDSFRLLEEIWNCKAKVKGSLQLFLQVNGSREASKGGFSYEELDSLRSENLREFVDYRIGPTPPSINGLMTMAAAEVSPEEVRSTFKEMERFAWERRLGGMYKGERVWFLRLSMGMSNDFEVAIEEGSTMVRLGSILFEGLPGPETDK